MSDGWKLAVLLRRREHLKGRIDGIRSDGTMHYRETKHDQREFEALDWAIPLLEAQVPE